MPRRRQLSALGAAVWFVRVWYRWVRRQGHPRWVQECHEAGRLHEWRHVKTGYRCRVCNIAAHAIIRAGW